MRKLMLDALDRRILDALQRDCTLSLAVLAEQTCSTKATCHRRVRSLISSGIIERCVAIVSSDRSLEPVTALIGLKISGQGKERQRAARAFLKQQVPIRMLWLTTGEFDYLAVAAFENVNGIRHFVDQDISGSELFESYRTFLALDELKIELFRRFV